MQAKLMAYYNEANRKSVYANARILYQRIKLILFKNHVSAAIIRYCQLVLIYLMLHISQTQKRFVNDLKLKQNFLTSTQV